MIIESCHAARVHAPIAMLAILALAGCVERDLRPEERLDPNTAVNVTIMAEPWIYSRDIPMPGASASDFLNVGVVETNRAGTRAYWLGVVAWSTVDRSLFSGAPLISRPVKIRLSWSAGSLELEPAENGRMAAGLGEPVFVDPQTRSAETWYPLTTAQLAQLGTVAPASIALIDETGQPTTYVPWRVNAAALSEFLKATGS